MTDRLGLVPCIPDIRFAESGMTDRLGLVSWIPDIRFAASGATTAGA